MTKPPHPSTAPDWGRYTRRERALIGRHRTPKQVQDFLRRLPYNWCRNGVTQRSFRSAIEHWEAHCLEGAVIAAALLEPHGHPPILLDLESQDGLGHTLLLFRSRNRWGAVGRSRDAGLHGRKPVFGTVRQLVWSYIDPYVDATGRLTGYALLDLRTLKRCDWRFSSRNLWALERALIQTRHRRVTTSEQRYRAAHRRYLVFRRKYPDRPVVYYPTRHQWL